MRLDTPIYRDGAKTAVQSAFGGIDRREGLADGRIYDLVGMSADKFPTLSSAPPRSRMEGAREVYAYFESLTDRWWQRQGAEGDWREEMPSLSPKVEGVFDVADAVYYVVSSVWGGAELTGGGEGLFSVRCAVYDAKTHEVITSEAISPYDRAGVRGVAFNSALVLWMDGGTLPDSPDRVVSFALRAADDEAPAHIETTRLSLAFPPALGGIWHDLAEAATHIRCAVPLEGLSVGDEVHLDYTCSGEETGKFVRIRALRTLEDGAWMLECDLDEALAESADSLESLEAGRFIHHATVCIERRIPQLEHICVSRDRIWGTTGCEIFACASCDSANWYRYEQSAAASFYATVPSVSEFTAVCSYAGGVFFFTREGAYRMYGSTPEAFSLSELSCYGAPKGADASFGIAEGLVFYNSTSGPACFDGEGSTLISRELGERLPACRCALGAGGRYYFSDGEYLYVRDVACRTWHREEARNLRSMLSISGRVVLFFEDGEALYHRAEEGEAAVGERVSRVEFGEFTDGCTYGSIPVEFTLRVRLGSDSRLALYISTPDGGRQRLWQTEEEGSGIYTVRSIPALRADSYRLILEGEGEWQLLSLARTYIPCTTAL